MKRICRQCADEMSILLGEKDAEIEALKSRLRWCRRKLGGWQRIGSLRNGEAIYCDTDGDIAIEKDHEFLVIPSEAEKKELKEPKDYNFLE